MTGANAPAPAGAARRRLSPRAVSSRRGGLPAAAARAGAGIALLLLAAVCAYSPRAEAQTTELLSATLVVKSVGGGDLGCSNGFAGARCSTSSILSDDDFSYDSTDYTLTNFKLKSSGRLDVEFEIPTRSCRTR